MAYWRLLIFILLMAVIANVFSALTIPDVVVKKPVLFTNNQAQTTIITQEQMTSIGVNSLSQALQTLGGVQLQDTTGNGSQVLLSMRGFGANASSNTLLLINGMPWVHPDIAPPDLNVIPIQEIKYIEIIAGSEGVLYGDQAVGGIINIITQDQTEEQVLLSCAGGSYRQKKCSAELNHHLKKGDFSLGIYDNHTDNYRVHNQYDQHLLIGRIKYPLGHNQFLFDFKIANENMLYPGALTGTEVGEGRRQASNDTDFFKDNSSYFHIQHRTTLNDHWQMITDALWNEMGGNGVLTSPFTQSRLTQYLKPTFKGHIGRVSLLTGTELERDQYHLDTTFGATDDNLQKYGLFGLASLPLTKRLILTFGARSAMQSSQLESGTATDTLNRALATTFGLTYALTSKLELYARRAGSFRFPKAEEIASTSPGTNGLKTQTGIAYETGFTWQYLRLMSKLSLYQLNLKDEIAFDPAQTTEDPFGTNRNLSPTQRRGFSYSEKYRLNRNITLDGQLNHVNAEFQNGTNAGNRIPLVAETIVHVGLNVAFKEHWNVYTEANYTGSQFPANDDANSGSPTGGYTLYHVNLRFLYRQFSASLRVNNIFNKKYYFYTVGASSYQPESFYPAPERNFLLALQYKI